MRSEPLYDASRFRLSPLAGTGIINPTVLQFGPDGALYVATRFGLIHRLEMERTPEGYRAARVETTALVAELPNHDDHGRPQPGVRGRLITGMAVTGTAESPVVYAVSSDPRVERPETDTNSGILSRLNRTAAGWRRSDLVRGLPRSRNDHAPNGIALEPDGRTLYLSIGSATNMGAPSEAFLGMSETPLTAAILAVDLERLGDTMLDLPTLDDPARPGAHDQNDPFGGNNGANEAMLPGNGIVRLHAEGLRNAYDLLWTPAGIMTIDNGPNAAYGGRPRGHTARHRHQAVEGGESLTNPLYFIPRPGLFFGHPNLARPAPAAYAARPGLHFLDSTNGLTRMPAGPGGSHLAIAAISLDGSLTLVTFDRAGLVLHRRVLLTGLRGMPLDVTTGGGAAVPSDSLWIADMGESAIYVFEPVAGQPFPASRLSREPVRTLMARCLLWWVPMRAGILHTARLVRARWASR
ncbi:MAG: hypothetical protein J0L64_03575 [Acidobacteria bacterium]|nr:hypothetical protein [Acidobacteriota bacterium]